MSGFSDIWGGPATQSGYKRGHYRPASETPFVWRFTGGPLVARYCTLAGYIECSYSKTFLKQPIKIDKIKVLNDNGSLMKVERMAECSLGASCNTFDLH